MAVDRFIIIRNVYLKGKNALIVTKKVTSICIAESQKTKKGAKLKNAVNSTKIKVAPGTFRQIMDVLLNDVHFTIANLDGILIKSES